jgi:hypothetical protein
MRKLLILPLLLLMSVMGSCQNGPTIHQSVLTWTQSATAGVTKNCIYRGSATGTYSIPALACIPAGTTYTDLSVTTGTTYHYAVTAQTGSGSTLQESPFSNDGTAVIPVGPAAPSNLNVPTQSHVAPPSPLFGPKTQDADLLKPWQTGEHVANLCDGGCMNAETVTDLKVTYK